MTKEKILSVVAMYRERFTREGIPKKRASPTCPLVRKAEMLAHAHYLADSVAELASNPEKIGKTNRHLGSLQTLLWIAGWYTLEELMIHNRPDES